MKTYFKFNLTGNKLFAIWLLFLVLFIVPYVAIILKFQHEVDRSAFLYLFPAILILIIISLTLTFYLTKLFIEGIEFNEQSFVFNGTIGRFIGVFLPGLLFCIITLGIYSPWFIKDINKFFVNNSAHNSNSLEFKGKGGELFLIILLTVIIPMIVLGGLMGAYTFFNHAQLPSSGANIGFQILTNVILIPYMYLIYKWMVDIEYKGYKIKWNTNAGKSCGKILVEMLLSIVTIGIYTPLAVLKLYKYFVERTEAISVDKIKKFDYDIEPLDDFLFLWGQILLMIITLGIYYPWATCKITSRILSKTYSEDVVA